jgi:plastocyanin
VPAGTVAVELWNRGQDAHDLRIRRLNSSGQMVGPVVGAVQYTLPGKVTKATWRLRTPGRYELYCSLPGHAALGMVAKLTVASDKA